MSTKSRILHELERNRGSFLSGETLAEQLSVSRSAVWKAVNELKKEGYAITSVTKKGYRLETSSDLISREGMLPFLSADYDPENLYIYKVIDSTNSEAKRLVAKGVKEYAVILSEEQTGGRGRLGRDFYSPVGSGIYMSMVLRPKISIEKAIRVTTAACVAVCRAIEEVTGKTCEIKWVNDIYSGNRKICGILTEAVSNFETGEIESIILGIGINFRRKDEEFPEEIRGKAGALFQTETGGITRNRLIASMINQLLRLNEMIESGVYIREYRERSLVIGKTVDLVSRSSTRKARVLGIDEDGGLEVLLEDGSGEVVRSGEISLRGLFEKE